MFLGLWKIDDLVTFSASTHNPATGAIADADADPTYRVYEDETAVPILTGSMAKLDDANTVGFYSEQLTLSAANGFENGKSYTIRIAGIVGGVTGVTERYLQVGVSPPTAAEIRIEMDSNSTDLNSIIANVGGMSGEIGAIRLVTEELATMLEISGGNYRYTSDALSQVPPVDLTPITAVTDQLVTMLEINIETGAHRYTTYALSNAPAGGGGGDPLAGIVEDANGSLPAVTLKDAMQFILSFMFGLTTGGGTSHIVFRDINNGRNCIDMTVDFAANRLSLIRVPL